MQLSDLQNDLQSLRKELLQAEQQKLDLESEKVSLTEKTKFLGIEKEKVIQKTRYRNLLLSKPIFIDGNGTNSNSKRKRRSK